MENTARIYKLTSSNTDKIYIGATKHNLNKRLSQHKNNYKKNSNISSKDIFNYGGVVNIELIEEFKYITNKELKIKEKYYISENKNICVNKNDPFICDYTYKKNEKLYNRDYKKYYYSENKDKVNKYKKNWGEKNKDKIKEYQKIHYMENKDKIKEYHKIHYMENKDKKKEYQKIHYMKNKEYIINSHKKYYLDNKDKLKEYRKKYYESNKEQIMKKNE